MPVLTEVDDLNAVVACASSFPDTDATPILLMGCSQGALVSALAAARLPGKIEKLVLFYPAFCILDDARKGKMMWAHFDPENLPSTIHCGPMKLGRRYAEDVMHMDPYREIRTFPGEVLIVHCTQDKIVDLWYVRKAARTYIQAGCRKVVFHTIMNGRHFFTGRFDREALKYLHRFLETD